MQLFAAAVSANVTAAERLQQIPPAFWGKLGLGILLIIASVIFLRKVVKMNKVMLTVGGGLACTIVGFNWIYERNEPGWASPTVQWLANYFPSKGKIEAKTH
jgi:hypothetical protein